MQSPKKVAKYLSQNKEVRIDDTRPPGSKPPAAHLPDLGDEALRIHSLTPVKVLEKIRQDVISVLGVQGSVSGNYTRLEQKLVDFLERIVRKGQCPSILVRERDLIEAMLALKKYFETDSVAIAPNEASPGGTINVPVFPALYKYAKEAAFCEQRIRELRTQRSRVTGSDQKKTVDNDIKQMRERKDNCLIYYQKVVFSDAEALAEKGRKRQITIFGKPVTLDDLLVFLKQGGRLEQARTRTHVPQAKPAGGVRDHPENDLDSSLGTFGDTRESTDDVVDWRKIKSNSEKNGDEDRDHYSFNL